MKAGAKEWFPVFQENLKRKEDDLIREIERWDALAESVNFLDVERDVRFSLKADLMALYGLEEINLI